MGTRGETDEYFEDARAFIESLNISQLHVFTYSERPNTQALKIDHIVDVKTKHSRSKTLLDISDQKLKNFYISQQGLNRKVLFEHTMHDNLMYGFTENYVKVEREYDESLVNVVKEVCLGGLNSMQTAVVLIWKSTQ